MVSSKSRGRVWDCPESVLQNNALLRLVYPRLWSTWSWQSWTELEYDLTRKTELKPISFFQPLNRGMMKSTTLCIHYINCRRRYTIHSLSPSLTFSLTHLFIHAMAERDKRDRPPRRGREGNRWRLSKGRKEGGTEGARLRACLSRFVELE